LSNLKTILFILFITFLGFTTSGSGTIQQCQSNGWDYCTINTNSTISLSDFSITNKGINISTNTIITLNASRLKLNTTEYLNVLGIINGSGFNAVSEGGNGGTGGGACIDSLCSFNGVVNGTNGINGSGGAGYTGNGSNVLPFEFTQHITNATSSSMGGGFYATGYCYIKTSGTNRRILAGGSGHAISLYSSGIMNITGSILADGGQGAEYGGSAITYYCGGSGGGEIILRANTLYLSGNISAKGGKGFGINESDGGEGGRIRICSINNPSITGTINASGGIANNSGINGTYGQIINCGDYWNVTYSCTDEMNPAPKNFTATIITGIGQILVSTAVNNYSSIPSEVFNYSTYDLQHPTGIYMTCWNGTLRYYISASTGTYNQRGYSLNTTLGSYYAFTVKNTLGAAVPNVQVSAYRYDNTLGAYAVVEQGITDSGGTATLYLQPLVPYRIIFVSNSYVTLTYDFVPSTTSSIQINLNPSYGTGTNSTIPQPMPNYQFAYGDISLNILPHSGTYANATNVSYTVISAGGYLEYWGMTVTLLKNGSYTEMYSGNLTTPTGGVMNWTTNTTGTYIITAWFKEQNFSTYTVLPVSFSVANSTNSFWNTRNHFIGSGVISSWVFYFISVVIAMLVAGFVSRYSYEGAAWVGLIVLWGFTIFMTPTLIPASGIIYTAVVGGYGIQITAWMATTLATIGVLVTTYIMKGGA
jgi:hypothetical protein